LLIYKTRIFGFGNVIRTHFLPSKGEGERGIEKNGKVANLPPQEEKAGSSYSITKNESESKSSSWFQDMKPETVACLAGLLQGEAQFSKDRRVRSAITSPDYIPPPPTPFIKIEMVEEDLMLYVASLIGENCIKQVRKTTSKKTVYRVSMYKREKVEAFLKLILPYVYGELKRGLILDLLADCKTYNRWVSEGGKTKAAQHAAGFGSNQRK